MSTNPNTKSYWRRVSRMAGKLAFAHGDKSVADIIAAADPKATRTMRREAIKMAIERCVETEQLLTREIDRYRTSRTTLQAYRDREPVSLRVIDGGGAEANRQRWPAVEE